MEGAVLLEDGTSDWLPIRVLFVVRVPISASAAHHSSAGQAVPPCCRAARCCRRRPSSVAGGRHHHQAQHGIHNKLRGIHNTLLMSSIPTGRNSRPN